MVRSSPRRAGFATAIALIAATLLPMLATAQDRGWDFRPRIASSVTWTDNVGLDPESMAIEQTALEVTPGFQFQREAQRLQASIDYRLQSLFFDDSDLNEINHFLAASGTATMYSDSLFLAFRSNITQQIVDPQNRVSVNTISGAGNRTEVMSSHLNPYWAGDVGGFAQGRVSFRYGLIEYDDPAVRDSKESEASLSLSGNPSPGGLNWTLAHSNNRTRYDMLGTGSEADKIDMARSSATVSYPVTPKARVVVTAGVDDNSFSFSGPRKIDGRFWQAGLSGVYGKFTNYEIRAGESFFGGSYYGLLQRTGRLLSLRVEYDDAATTVGREQLDYLNFLNYLSQVAGLELNVSQPQLYVRRRLTGTATLKLNKTNFEARVYSETRDYLVQDAFDDDDGVFGVSLRAGWQATESTDIDVDANWRSFDLRGTALSPQSTPEDTVLQLRVRRQLGNGFDLTMRALHNQRGAANSSNQEYKENVISVGIGKTF